MKINWDKAQKVFDEQEPEPIDKSSQATVLVVDDEAPNLTLYRAALEQRFNVLTAQSGDEALTVHTHTSGHAY